MDEVKKVKNFVLPLYFCGKREVFTFTVSPRSFRSTLLCAADCSSSFFFPFRLEAGSYNPLNYSYNFISCAVGDKRTDVISGVHLCLFWNSSNSC